VYIKLYTYACTYGAIYDVHTEGVRLRWTLSDGGGESAPCGRPHRKLEINDDVQLMWMHVDRGGYLRLQISQELTPEPAHLILKTHLANFCSFAKGRSPYGKVSGKVTVASPQAGDVYPVTL